MRFKSFLNSIPYKIWPALWRQIHPLVSRDYRKLELPSLWSKIAKHEVNISSTFFRKACMSQDCPSMIMFYPKLWRIVCKAQLVMETIRSCTFFARTLQPVKYKNIQFNVQHYVDQENVRHNYLPRDMILFSLCTYFLKQWISVFLEIP